MRQFQLTLALFVIVLVSPVGPAAFAQLSGQRDSQPSAGKNSNSGLSKRGSSSSKKSAQRQRRATAGSDPAGGGSPASKTPIDESSSRGGLSEPITGDTGEDILMPPSTDQSPDGMQQSAAGAGGSAQEPEFVEESEAPDDLNPFAVVEGMKKHLDRLTGRSSEPEHHKSKPREQAVQKKPVKPKLVPFSDQWNQKHLARVTRIVVIVFLAMLITPWVTRRLVRFLTSGREGSEVIKRMGTATQIFSKFAVIILFLIGTIEILKEFEIDVGPMLTGAGIFGVALGFAGQNLLKDLLSGTFLIFEEQIRVGDFVEVAGQTGTVEDISLRKVTLRNFNGDMLYIPNSKIDIVINKTREFSRYVIEIPVAYRESYDDVVEVLDEVDEELRADDDFKDDILEPLTIYGLSKFGTNGYVITVRTTTKPGMQWRAAREYRRRIKERFDEKDIHIPVPHLTIYPGVDPDGGFLPFKVETVGDGKS